MPFPQLHWMKPFSTVLQWLCSGSRVSSDGRQPDCHLWKISHQLLDHGRLHPDEEAGLVRGESAAVEYSRPQRLWSCSTDACLLSNSHQKHDKPKYVLCVAFAENGDAITGDSSGNIYVWAKGGDRNQIKPNLIFHMLRKRINHLEIKIEITMNKKISSCSSDFHISSERQVGTESASRCRGPMREESSPFVSWRTALWCQEEGRTARWCCGATTTGRRKRWRWWTVGISGLSA